MHRFALCDSAGKSHFYRVVLDYEGEGDGPAELRETALNWLTSPKVSFTAFRYGLRSDTSGPPSLTPSGAGLF